MIKALESSVDPALFIQIAIVLFLIAYFVYKEWPDFKKRISKGEVKDQKDSETERSVEARLSNIEKDIGEIKEKLNRDYDRINEIDQKQKRYQTMVNDSAEELELIMEALLGALGGLQELGANGPTKEAKENLQNYLNRKAHRTEE